MTVVEDVVAQLLTELWAPFATDRAPDHRIDIERVGEGWTIGSVGGERGEFAYDVWNLAIVVRQELERLALDIPGHVGIHAAALGRDGRCCLLAGPNGVGKTTLALELMDRGGWRLVSDDLVLIDRNGGNVVPFPRPVGIKGVARWPEFTQRWALAPRLPVPDLFFQVPPRMFPLTEAANVEPAFLLFPRFESDVRGELESLSPARAILELTSMILQDVDPGVMEVAGDLTRRVRSARLTYRSSAEALELLQAFLPVSGSNR